MANSKVPKFGAWEEEENVDYTMDFENARKYKNPGQMAHPNDPQRNLDMFPHQNPPTGGPLHVLKAESKEPPTYEQRTGRVGGNSMKAASTPPRQNNMSCSSTNEQVQQHPGGRASPAGDHRNPGGATPRRRSDILARGTGVPKFGGWVDDPEQAEAYTSVFDGLRQEKRGQAIPSDGLSNATPSHQTDNAKKEIESVKCHLKCARVASDVHNAAGLHSRPRSRHILPRGGARGAPKAALKRHLGFIRGSSALLGIHAGEGKRRKREKRKRREEEEKG